MAQEKRTHI